MIKKLFKIIRKIVLALCMLYTVNLIVSKIGIIVPINITTIAIVSILGLPSILGLIILNKML